MTMNNQNILYIAYGSNLNQAQMANRCPTARAVGKSVIKDYRLLFRGFRGPQSRAVATVEPYKGGSVPVLVWEITPTDEAALDRFEGFPYSYRKEQADIILDGKPISAMVYIMNEEMPERGYRTLGQPEEYYYNIISDGYKTAGFDLEILRKATFDSVEPDENDSHSGNVAKT